MPYYKDTGNQLHFLDDTAFEYMLPEGSIQITDEEAGAIRAEQDAATPAPEPVEPVTKLKDFLAANPDVAALLGA
jgi:hypothetical protein